MNKFTERAQRVIFGAQDEAKFLNHDYVGPEHLLLGLLQVGEGIAADVLKGFGADYNKEPQSPSCSCTSDGARR